MPRTITAEYGVTRNVHVGHRSLDLLWEGTFGAMAKATRGTGLDAHAVAQPGATVWSPAAPCDEALIDWPEIRRRSSRQDGDVGRLSSDERDESAIDEYENSDGVFDLLGSFSL
jgi:hypothetical protein